MIVNELNELEGGEGRRDEGKVKKRTQTLGRKVGEIAPRVVNASVDP
mgnify:CR=1 FL=1